MNKLGIAGLAVALVVVAGGAFLLLQNNSTNQSPAQQEQTQNNNTQASPSPESESEGISAATEVQVTLTESGFEPKDITVEKGTKVIWTNNSGENATVDSNPHPIHTSYPEMNLGSFSDGETLEFTYNESGTFQYHDHFNASRGGSVTVR